MREIFILSILLLASSGFSQTPKKIVGDGVTGDLTRYENFRSKNVDSRNVDVWLPPDYSPSRKYSVLYMHDGQNLFNPKESYGGVDWGIDETVTRLISERRIPPLIVVAIWNTPKRFEEYMPQKAFALATSEQRADIRKFRNADSTVSDNYLKFIVDEVKPFVDKNYSTRRGRKHTGIMGSSMGGLISLYAISEYPEVFGAAGCVSTHFPIGNGVVIEYMKTSLPDPNKHRIYFDYGTETLDATYEPFQLKADDVMRAKGFTKNNWITKKFPGEEHSERSWRKRVEIPLEFLFSKSN